MQLIVKYNNPEFHENNKKGKHETSIIKWIKRGNGSVGAKKLDVFQKESKTFSIYAKKR